MNFEQAITELRKGKKITRPCWKKNSYWSIGKDEKIMWNNKENAVIHFNQIHANDFEIYKEKEYYGFIFVKKDEKFFFQEFIKIKKEILNKLTKE